ncbi:MAG: DUF1573 domain-containing protein [Acidobacteria bacterium]|jgi:hypothetical protein|nr:DUF1573 domain-containing protein [Acidobacteriota bacterium]
MFRSVAAVMLAGSVTVMAGSAPVWAERKANFPERSFETGDVQLGNVIEHVFMVENDGDEPLTITEVHPTCGCTILDFTATPIPPGGRGKIQFKIETKALATGKHSKTITVMTDAPNAERTVLQMKFNVVTALEFLPRSQVYMYTVKGEPRVEKVLLRPHVPGLKVLGVTSSNPNLKASIKASKATVAASGEVRGALTERPGDYWITLELPSGVPVGTFKADVALQTSDPKAVAGNALRVLATVKQPGGSTKPGNPS